MRTYLPVLLLLFIGITTAASNVQPQSPAKANRLPPNQAVEASEAKSEPDNRGTMDHPAVVDLSPSSVPKIEAIDKTERPIDHLSPEWLLAYFTGALALITGGLALYTFRLYRATVGLGRDAKQTAKDQTNRMERSVVEANRAATAMEAVALATNNNAALMQTLIRKQMRAYVSVEVGVAVYQDARLRFEAKPNLVNNGLTPARNVSIKALAAIIDGSGPAAVTLPDVGAVPASDVGLAPRQILTMSAVVDGRLPDAEVEEVMTGSTRRLFAWGKVTYDDVYGESWETNFCVNYAFFMGADNQMKVWGYYCRWRSVTV